jgi:hypothetical protein
MGNIELLNRLPLAFLPLLLREIIVYDWKFPAERQEVDGQFKYLGNLSFSGVQRTMAGFAAIQIGPELAQLDWVNDPAGFSERLTAHLWSSQQIGAFRTAATEFINAFHLAIPKGPPAMRRLAITVIGEGVKDASIELFQKLRPHGALFTRLNPENGWQTLFQNVQARARQQPLPFSHWYIEGSAPAIPPTSDVTTVSWASVASMRTAIIDNMRKLRQAGRGTEELRQELGRLLLQDTGLREDDSERVISHFKMSILAEGSGVQFFSTTFVQWTAREALRRAQPLTLLARFTPRHTEKSMNEALSGTLQQPEFDPEGSLVDADMGSYYTWLNLRRLPGTQDSAFLAWFENHKVAFAISPACSPGTISSAELRMDDLLKIATT